RGRATLRLRPPETAAAYDVTLEMGSPEPSPFEAPRVRVSVDGGAAAEFTLTREVRPYTLRTPAPPGGEVRVELQAPTWNRSDAFADQGVRVDAFAVAPVR